MGKVFKRSDGMPFNSYLDCQAVVDFELGILLSKTELGELANQFIVPLASAAQKMILYTPGGGVLSIFR